MTTEETELTFVRCPNCRSLVPAVASRCRMCGYHFEGEDDALEQEGSQKKSRVRQRTISVSKEEVEDITRQVVDDDSTEEHDLDSDDNPIEFPSPSDLEQGERWGVDDSSLFSIDSDDDAAEDPEEDISDLDDDSPSVRRSEVFFSLDEELGQRAAEDRIATEVDSPGLEEDEISSSRSIDAASYGDEQVEEPNELEGAGDFSPTETDDDEEARELDENNESLAREQVASEGERSSSSRRRRRRRRRKREAPKVDYSPSGEALAEEPESGEEEKLEVFEKENEMAGFESVDEGKRFVGNESKEPQPEESVPAAVANEGELVGWLVSYAQDALGLAVELRAGKFFIGRQRLRSHDMVIADSAISTPHCLVSADSSSGLKIQDLMSDQGTFVKKRSDSSYSKVKDSVSLEHGDYLRLGGYEVLVCLVPKAR